MYLLQAILSVIGPVLGRAFPVQAERKSPRPRVIDQNAAFTRLCPFVWYGEALANELLFGKYPLTVGIEYLSGCIDRRFGSGDRYHLTAPKDIAMRVPDEIRKSVLFIGVKEDLPEWEWKGTGYLIAIRDAQHMFSGIMQHEGQIYSTTFSYPFMFLATARHVAEKLEGRDFALRTNKLDGSLAILEGHADQQWWYHPLRKNI